MSKWGIQIIFAVEASDKKEAAQKARNFIAEQHFGRATGLSITVHPLDEPRDERDWKNG